MIQLCVYLQDKTDTCIVQIAINILHILFMRNIPDESSTLKEDIIELMFKMNRFFNYILIKRDVFQLILERN